MGKISITIGTLLVIIVLVLTGLGTYQWVYNRDYNTLYKDGEIIARSRWYVDMQRFYYNIKYKYQYDNCLRDNGTISESGTRCYLPDETFYRLTRKLLSIELDTQNLTDKYIVTRKTSYNKYGTRGATAGTLFENITHNKIVNDIKEFPESYGVSYIPRDSSYYKLVWKVDKLKDINLPDGKYTDCNYQFGAMKINLENECDKLDYVLVENDENRIWIYFKKVKGSQDLKVDLVDPNPLLEDLLYYWDFDDNANATLGGINRDGVVSGATHFDAGGVSDGFYHFDGINDYIAFNQWFFNTITDFSVSLWFKANSTEAGCTNVKNVGVGTDPVNPGVLINNDRYGIYRIAICNNNSRFFTRFGDGEYGSNTANMGSPYTWNHFVVSYWKSIDYNHMTVCRNGDCKNLYYVNPYYLFSGFYHAVYMGKTVTSYPSYATGNQYNGSIDEVAVWGRVLSLNEMQELYNNGTGLFYTKMSDETAPVVSLQSPINYLNTTSNTNNSNFTYQVTDDLGVLKCDLWLNNGTWYINDTDTGINKSIDQTFNKTLEEGIFNWKVGCEDENNYYANSSERTTTVDYSPPVINLKFPLNNSVIKQSTSVNFTYNVTDAGVDVDNCTLWLDDVSNKTDMNIEELINQTHNVTNLNYNNHTWKVECYDTLGFSDNSTIRQIDMNTPPVIKLQAPVNNTFSYSITPHSVDFIFNVSDVDNIITQCNLLTNQSGNWESNYTFVEYDNKTDGFSSADFAISPTTLIGITTNGTDFWIVDSIDDFIYHINKSGYNFTDGISISAYSEEPRGITTNGSDFWITDFYNGMFHINSAGERVVNDDVDLTVNCSSSITNAPITTNGTDFWIVDSINEWVYHLDASFTNLSDGFSTSFSGASSSILGITTNGSDFWIFDRVDDWVYHISLDGSINYTDGFGIDSSILGEGITTDAFIGANGGDPLDFWITNDVDDWVHHFEKELTEVVNHSTTLSFGINDKNIDWKIRCKDSDNQAWDSNQNIIKIRDRPVVEIYSPVNNSLIFAYTNLEEEFIYNVTDDTGDIDNCTLFTYLNGIWSSNDTDTSITESDNQTLNFAFTDDVDDMLWKVGCYDNMSVQGNSSIFNLSISINDPPIITLITPINNTIEDNESINFVFAASDEDTSTLNCSLLLNDNDGGWVVNQTSTDLIQNYTDQSDGVNIGTFCGATCRDWSINPKTITIDNSQFWLPMNYQGGNIWVYHLDSELLNITDGFDIDDIVSGGGTFHRGITTNGTDFWITFSNGGYVQHVNSTGGNITTGFSTGVFGATHPYGITTNGSDFWITDELDDWIYHVNASGDNQSDGFRTLSSTGSNFDLWDIEFDVDNTLWYIVEHNNGNDDIVYHVNLSGDAVPGGFNTNDFDCATPRGITTTSFILEDLTTPSNEFFITCADDNFIYHLKEEIRTTFPVNFSVIDHEIEWRVQCEDEISATNSTVWLLYIDVTNPIVSLQFPLNNTNSSTIYNNFTYTANDGLLSIKNCTLYLEKGGVWESNKTDLTITETINQTLNITLEDSNILWKVGCYDNASHQGNSSSYNFTSDGTSPVITWVSPTENNNTYFNITAIPMNVTVTELFEKNITFTLLNSSDYVFNFTAYINATRYINYTDLGNDNYHYIVEVCDDAGHCTSIRREITLDSLYPVVVYDSTTREDNSLTLLNWTYVGVDITDISYKNITLELFNSTSQRLDIVNYTNSTHYNNFTSNMTDYGWYLYNVTVCDYLDWCTSTLTRRLKYIQEYTVTIELSPGISDILFYPPNMTCIVEPEDQTSVVGIIKVTNDNITAVDIMMKLNETRDDISLYANEEYSQATWQSVNKSYFTLIDNMSVGSEGYIWLYAYYQDATRKWVFPELEVIAGLN